MDDFTTREKLLQAVVSVAQSDGVTGLTLEKVAAVAGVSKGGLLYHFPTKKALLSGLVEAGLAEFQDAIKRYQAAGKDWLSAYTSASLGAGQGDAWASSLLVPLLNHPELLDPLRLAMRDWYATAHEQSGAAGQLVLLALDGLYLHQLSGMDISIDISNLLGLISGFLPSALDVTL